MTWLTALKRLAPYAAALTAFAGYSSWVYEAGKEQARNAAQAENIRLANKHKAELEQSIADALDVQAQDHADAIERLRNEREVVTVVRKEVEHVEKIIVDDACVDLARDFVGMRQRATRAIRSAASAAHTD